MTHNGNGNANLMYVTGNGNTNIELKCKGEMQTISGNAIMNKQHFSDLVKRKIW